MGLNESRIKIENIIDKNRGIEKFTDWSMYNAYTYVCIIG